MGYIGEKCHSSIDKLNKLLIKGKTVGRPTIFRGALN